jgi:phosphoglycerol transferase MdoB-like AlkP superfamily enzyme
MLIKIYSKLNFFQHSTENNVFTASVVYFISLFLVLIVLKTKLYLRYRTYAFSNGLLFDLLSIILFDFLVALLFLLIFYLLKILFGKVGFLLAQVIYIALIVFSTLSTITYLRIGAPINAGMIGDIKYDFLKSSIEQQTDIKLLLAKLILIIIVGLLLPLVFKKVLRNYFHRRAFLGLSCLLILSLLVPAYLNANRLGEPDLWKTPIQTLVEPIFIKYSQDLFNSKSNRSFSLKSPFNSKRPEPPPQYSFSFQKENVVIYFMEGVPLKLMREVSDDGFLPNIEKLLETSLSPKYYYPTAADSTKGIFSIITSMYPYPGYKKMTNVSNDLNCQSLPKILEKNGYNTAIISSGSFAWDHIRYFFDKHFKHLIDQTTISKKKSYSQFSWGLDDKFLVDQLDNMLTYNRGPHFIILVPTNSHHPYLTPDKKFKQYSEGNSVNKLKNSICYQDYIVGKVNKVLENHGIANNTFTIVTSDHSIRFSYGNQEEKGKPQISPGEEQNAIPLIISHPNVRKKFYFDIIGSHLDIAPTVLSLLGLKAGGYFQGINLLQEYDYRRVHFIISTVKNFNIILRDHQFQYYYDISNNRIAIRHENLSSSGREYLPPEFPVRSDTYKKMCLQFINFQRQYLERIFLESGNRESVFSDLRKIDKREIFDIKNR